MSGKCTVYQKQGVHAPPFLPPSGSDDPGIFFRGKSDFVDLLRRRMLLLLQPVYPWKLETWRLEIKFEFLFVVFASEVTIVYSWISLKLLDVAKMDDTPFYFKVVLILELFLFFKMRSLRYWVALNIVIFKLIKYHQITLHFLRNMFYKYFYIINA